jgi:hypothetical protein
MNIFYAYSNNRDETRITYEKICEKIDNIIDVDNNDINNSHQLLDKIKNHIKNTDIFVCDITPDNIITENEIPLPNPNVMIELGFALHHFENNNIILLLNEHISKKVPSMLYGFEVTYYDSDNSDYYLDICDKINSNIDNLYEKKEWKNFNYILSSNFIIFLQDITNCTVNDYIIRINNRINQAVILFPSNKDNKINIISKKLKLKNKEICFSKYYNLYNELQHLELIINLKKDS